MKKKISLLIASIAFFGLMALNVHYSIEDLNSAGLNLKVLSASAAGGCSAADSNCTQTWWTCNGGDCWQDDVTFTNMTEY